jgi:transcriptional regulator with AAA-type ATPase domain
MSGRLFNDAAAKTDRRSFPMALMNASERKFAEVIAELAYCNPFLPHRIELERAALGPAFDEQHSAWNMRPEKMGEHPNVASLRERSQQLMERVREKIAAGQKPGEQELPLYEDLVIFMLYHRYREGFDRSILAPGNRKGRVALYDAFEEDAERYVGLPGLERIVWPDIAHGFACVYQVRRAFHHIFGYIIGVSKPSIRLRASVWQSIFTHDMRRFRRTLYNRMADFTTLIQGPSGTGKEVVAQAVGLSRYIAFDARTRNFTEDFSGSFAALNLSAMSPTLIESELFGHKRGSYTGAVADRAGWLEHCPPQGTVFLDEIGELDETIQVKLLRVIQSRRFNRLGDTKDLEFKGKIIAATNRDLAAEMQAGRFRTDFYYRLCSDMITTPTLRAQLADTPEDLHRMVLYLTRRIVGDEAEAVTAQVVKWIEENLGMGYDWPGNVRELEQCVRNVLVRGEYLPPRPQPADDKAALLSEIYAGELTAEQLLQRYCKIVYSLCGSYEQASRRLELDRRTVKAKVESGG